MKAFEWVSPATVEEAVAEAGRALALLGTGWPLMLNALLVGLFFRVDQFIIKPVAGSLAVEQYQAAYAYLNFVLIITPAIIQVTGVADLSK